jgi:cell division septation protein DedD
MDKESVEQIRSTGDAAGQNQPNDQKTNDDRSKCEEQPAASDDYSKNRRRNQETPEIGERKVDKTGRKNRGDRDDEIDNVGLSVKAIRVKHPNVTADPSETRPKKQKSTEIGERKVDENQGPGDKKNGGHFHESFL